VNKPNHRHSQSRVAGLLWAYDTDPSYIKLSGIDAFFAAT
jgi:hypothetical protein